MVWRDRLYGARDRLLANPKFQRWASSFPLTRTISQRRARALFDLTAGFVYAQILSACVRLGLLQRLMDRPRSLSELSTDLSLDRDATQRLLKAAMALGLVAQRGAPGGEPRFGLGMDGAALLGNPGVLAMIDHHALFYRDLADPVALLRREAPKTALSRFWPYADHHATESSDDDAVAPYSRLMAASQPLVCDDILDAYDFSRHRRLLDVGGGEGLFLCGVAQRVPALDLVLFDLPAVAHRAQQQFERSGLAHRTTAVGGDLWRDALPAGADVCTLVRVLHDHDDDQALRLLQSVRHALEPGGALVIAEPMSAGRDGRRVGDAYFGFYLLAMGSGRARAPAEIADMLAASGFSRIARRKTARPFLTSMLVAHRD